MLRLKVHHNPADIGRYVDGAHAIPPPPGTGRRSRDPMQRGIRSRLWHLEHGRDHGMINHALMLTWLSKLDRPRRLTIRWAAPRRDRQNKVAADGMSTYVIPEWADCSL